MCFYLDLNERDVKIATEDILVWKVVYDGRQFHEHEPGYRFYSFHQGFPYDPGKTYHLGEPLAPRRQMDDYQISDGFHSWTEEPEVLITSTAVLMFKVPKGTRYYINREAGEIVVSDAITCIGRTKIV